MIELPRFSGLEKNRTESERVQLVQAFTAAGYDPVGVGAVIQRESAQTWSPNMKGPKGAFSMAPGYPVGLIQFAPQTAQRLGTSTEALERMTFEEQLPFVVAYYNLWGPSAFRRPGDYYLAGWGAHPLDVMIWGLKDKLSGKYTCEGTGGFWQPGGIYNNVRAWDVNIEYEAGVKLHFMDTDGANSSGMLDYLPFKDGNGTTFYGSKGWISLGRNSALSDIPEINEKLNDSKFPRNSNGTLAGENNTMGELFIDIVKGNVPEVCPLDEAILSDTVSHISNIAIRTGRKVTWDPAAGEVVNDAEANNWFIRTHREPYTV